MALTRILHACAILVLVVALPAPAPAQFLGYTSPATTQERVLNAVAVATASNPVRNIGQSAHYVTYATTGTVLLLNIQIEGSSDCSTNWIRISETATTTTTGAIYATAYLPCVRVNLTALIGTAPTLTAYYSGTSVTPGDAVGAFATSGVSQKVLGLGLAANANRTFTVELPAGGTGGTLYFKYSDGACAGSTVAVSAGPISTHLASVLAATALAASASVQTFRISFTPGATANVVYTSGCGAATTYDLFYAFGGSSFSTVDINSIAAGTNLIGKVNVALGPSNEDAFVCGSRAAVSLTASGNTQIIAAAGGQTIRICSLSFSCSTGVDVKIVEGTGANCATGPVDITGVYKNVMVFEPESWGPTSALRSSASQAVCVNLSAAVTCGGSVIFAQF